jgi:MFS family permease
MKECFISGFGLISPTLSIALDIPAGRQIWPASSFSLVAGAVLLPMSRIADVWGSYRVFVGGLFWFAIWSLDCGFSQNFITLVILRAIQGFGPAAFLPSGVMLLGSMYRPGPRKNLVFSLYGALSMTGFFAGIFSSGITDQYLSWRWYFWIGGIILFVVAPLALLAAPKEPVLTVGSKMDWWGLCTIVPGLLLVVYALTDSAHTPNGWAAPQIFVTFVLGCLFLLGAVYVEGWVVEQPLLPADLFENRCMVPLLISLFFSFGVFGIYLIYAGFQ